jgi:hypothetical protein
MTCPWPALVLALGLAWLGADADAAPPIPGARAFASGGAPQARGLSAASTRITLAPIAATELLGGVDPARGSRVLPATVTARGLQANASIDPPPLAAFITRELREVWRYAPDPKRLAAEMPRVRVELHSQSGHLGELSLRDNPAIGVRVGVRTRQSLQRSADGAAWYVGDVVLDIPVAAFSAAGTYAGRIEISQESL